MLMSRARELVNAPRHGHSDYPLCITNGNFNDNNKESEFFQNVITHILSP